MCKRFEKQLFELQSLRSAHQEAVNTIEALQSAHQEAVSTIEALRNQLSQSSAESKQSLENITTQKNQLVAQRDRIIASQRAELRQQQKAFAEEKEQCNNENKIRQDERHASKALARADQALAEQRLFYEQVLQRADEAQRLPRAMLRSSFATRPVQPFVVVLIDGDAYKVTKSEACDPRSRSWPSDPG